MNFCIYTRNITKKVKQKTILENLKLCIPKKSFVALVGPSGAGKTTLLNILSGYDKDFEGDVYCNGYNIKKDDLREEIAYVPQKEILHKDLTLYRELWYIAKMRMTNITKEKLDAKIKKVIEELELTGKETTLIKHLSGGEKRRLSIALELLFEPQILILDEPTSGLDLHIQKKLMQLLKKISQKGTTIIISAHTTADLNLCNQIFVMGNHGQICYSGTYENCFKYFHVKEFVDIYDLVLKDTTKYEEEYLKEWEKKNVFKVKKEPLIKSKRNIIKEIFYLILRHFEILWHDKFTLLMLFGQGILIALLINSAVPKDGLKDYNTAKITLFATSCAAMWIGLFNSVQEIVKEKSIIKREFMSSLNLNAFIISKIISFFIIGVVQSILFILVLFFHFEFPTEGLVFSSTIIEYIVHFLMINFSSCMLGLWISCVVKKLEPTLILAIIYMMLQLIFSGILLPLEGWADKLSNVIIGRHAVSLFGSSTNLIDVVKTTRLNDALDPSISSLLFLEEAEKFFEYQNFHIYYIWFVLLDMALLFAFLSSLTLKLGLAKGKD